MQCKQVQIQQHECTRAKTDGQDVLDLPIEMWGRSFTHLALPAKQEDLTSRPIWLGGLNGQMGSQLNAELISDH